MAQEDDLRALGKIMDFLRAVSIILAIQAADMHIAGAATLTIYVARGIAGKDAASYVKSHYTAARKIPLGVYF